MINEHRVTYADLFDAEIRRHYERFRDAAGVGPRDRVLDIGCGAGQSTRDAARAAVDGSAVGVDLAEGALEYARRRSAEEGLRNVSFVRADAQVHAFPPARFNVCISRFGSMFFADPVAAFTNLRRAVVPGGRLVLLVWQEQDRNEWSFAIRQALASGTSPHADDSPFALGDPAVAEGILAAAGFTEIDFTEVHEPVYYGPDTATACDFVLGLREPKNHLASLDAAVAEQALHRLRDTIAAHDTGTGVFFDSRAWIIKSVAR